MERVVANFSEISGNPQVQNVELIAQNLEKYISVQMVYVQFNYLCQFLCVSLDQLVGNLAVFCMSGKFDLFHHTRKHKGKTSRLC